MMMLNVIKILRFGFVNIPISSKYYHTQLPNKIQQIIQIIKNEKKLNQKCFLLQHLSDVLLADPKLILTYQQKSFLNNQLQLWKNGSGRFQNIATVAWVIKKLNLIKKHKELYQQIIERVLNDQWYVNFDQSVKALQAFADLPQTQQKIQMLQKIQRNIGITVWNVNMQYYRRISLSLLEAGRFDSPLWEKIETQILQNLGMNYDPKTICDIFKAFAISKNGHDVFYQMMEKVLFQGHFTQRSFKLDNRVQSSGQFLSLIVQTYSLAYESKSIILTSDFLSFIYKSLNDEKLIFEQLSSITKTLKNLKGLTFQRQQIQQIEQIILDKKPLRISIGQIKQFYQFCNFQYGKIPQNMQIHIQKILIKDINNKFIPCSQLVDLIKYLQQNEFIYNQKSLYLTVNTYLQNNFKYLYSQEAKYVIEQSKSIKQLESKNYLKLLPSIAKQVV